jgi:hypothetical protein
VKPWKIEIRPDKKGGLVLRMIADVNDRVAEEVAKRIERVLSSKRAKA